MNVIFVMFDTLRKDCVGAYGTPAPWGKVHTPNLDAFAREATVFTRAYPEVLPTLPARRAIYTGQRVYPFWNSDFRLKGDFVGAPGWGPIPEEQDTIAELLRRGGYRTGLVGDCYHMFKPSKNYTRGFDQWTFLRGQEQDPARSGPEITDEQLAHWLAPELYDRTNVIGQSVVDFTRNCLRNMHGRIREEDYFNAQVMIEAGRWLEQNRDAKNFYLVVESFDPHEPWFVPDYYRRMYDDTESQEQVISIYDRTDMLSPHLLRRAQANYSGLVTMCDHWFGYLYEKIRVLGLLDNTIIIVGSDHGHAMGDGNYMGKRGYPSHPSVFDLVLMVRHPGGEGAGRASDILVQHTDMSAQILEFAGVTPQQALHGRPFWKAATGGTNGRQPFRDHVTVGWGGAMTVITERWWMNCKVNGTGTFLHDLTAPAPFETNLADANPDIVRQLYAYGVKDAGDEFPEYLLELAASQNDAPGCSALAARV
ncbi:MAG: sulfatase [Anaerolineae bacterium]|nr:sulfatase [Anaerolineae bacterium]